MWSDATASRLRALVAQSCDQQITLRRGATTLAAQAAALALTLPRDQRDPSSQAAHASVRVIGAPELNIQAGDRFTWNGALCEVTLVRPDRAIATVADAKLVR